MSITADYGAMLRYLVKGEIRLVYIPEVLVKMRVGGTGTLVAKIFSKLGEFLPQTRKASE